GCAPSAGWNPYSGSTASAAVVLAISSRLTSGANNMAVKTPEEIERRHVPTIAKLRYGDTPSLAKLTPESARLAAVADATHSAALDVLTYIKRLRADPTQSEASRTLAEMQYARSTLARIDKMHDEAQR